MSIVSTSGVEQNVHKRVLLKIVENKLLYTYRLTFLINSLDCNEQFSPNLT